LEGIRKKLLKVGIKTNQIKKEINMGDPDSDIRNCQERDRLIAINPQKTAERLRELFPLVEEYQKIKIDLTTLGYRIKTDGGILRIWKEI